MPAGSAAACISGANLMAQMNKTNNPVVSAVLKTVCAEKDHDQAHALWREVAGSLRDRFREVARYASLDPPAIDQQVEVIVEHFRRHGLVRRTWVETVLGAR